METRCDHRNSWSVHVALIFFLTVTFQADGLDWDEEMLGINVPDVSLSIFDGTSKCMKTLLVSR
jgi:hypothetical protein